MLRSIFAISAVFLLSLPSVQASSASDAATSNYSPYVASDFPDQVLFGDSHLHTSYSWDAGMIGNTLGPEEAYRFAKGEKVTSSTGLPVRLRRPLDWLAVTDHAEALGVSPMLIRADSDLLADEFGAELYKLYEPKTSEAIGAAYNFFVGTKSRGENPLTTDAELAVRPWEEIIDAAEAANEPGRFTALIGFEWSSAVRGNNLHRVVLYRDGKAVANTRVPLSADLNSDPEALWDWMAALESDTGGRVLAIPHNGNLSNGQMFPLVRFDGKTKLDASYAKRRQRFEPVYEVTQMKGDGEAHPTLSKNDPFADFETFDNGSLAGNEPKTPDMFPGEYARPALQRGLAFQSSLGVNPYKFGMVGSTDSHTSLSTTGEDNFFGKVAQLEPTADPIRFDEILTGRNGTEEAWQRAWQTSAAGLAAVWARDNTRESIFDAMMRKEVYATTGTRMRVRVFAGFDFSQRDLSRPDFAEHGYSHGVPMGGDLFGSGDHNPRFLVQALRDPDGANLDRVQIVKGWLNADGSTSEQIYDVACGGRKLIGSRCENDISNTVDKKTASWTNDIGEPSLAAYWEDPNFDIAASAFYYVRVLEIPTPRWTTYDSRFFGVDLPEEAPVSTQDRAYTSPIWYTPTMD
jgi:hypothetical protein